MPNLDDPTQTLFYIPYEPLDDDETEDKLQDAYIAAYRTAWTKCFTQLRSEIDALYSPTVDAIVLLISTAYEDILPGLPYPELPFIAVHNASALFIDTLFPCLLKDANTTAISHLYPSDVPNLSTGMRTLISNFVKKSKQTKLAAYDIALLNAYYTSSVMLFSTRIPALHLAFLAFLSSPSTPTSYIHSAYPRNTLTRLRIHSFAVQVGRTVLEKLLLGTFFNPSFDPDLVLGPAAFEGIIDYYLRHNGSIDALLTSIQLVHLKHFLTEPLSLLIHPPPSLSSDPTFTPILDLVQSRLPPTSPDTLLDTLHQHTSTFSTASRSLRVSFILLHKTITFLTGKGYKPFPSHTSKENFTTNLMLSVLRGQTSREIKTLTMYIKKLRLETFHSLLNDLYDVYSTLPDEFADAKAQLEQFLDQTIPTSSSSSSSPDFGPEEFSTWFSTHLTTLLRPLDQYPLWDIWYTGSSPFPSELLNPSPRSSILSALLRPYDFTLPLPLPPQLRQQSPTVSELEVQFDHQSINPNLTGGTEEGRGRKVELHNLPDTSILFTRYLDSGKLINIHDWYESFRVCLDAQRAERLSLKTRSKSKSKGKGKGKAKSTAKKKIKAEKAEEGGEELDMKGEEYEEPDEERWNQEVQARFMRALHELDYLGFVKHTGRRVEHVVRTVFDVGDEADEEGGEGDDDV
ncbi:Origin recognition complex subunit 3 [Leucoagaricus sp. SymC.cos]|nr:Origin recognition complex subunit 3 [Leucoagaricus sp. SymC.cos]